MVPRENLEESVVRTGRDFPAGGNPCLYRKGFPRWGKSLSFAGTYPYSCHTAFVSVKKIGRGLFLFSLNILAIYMIMGLLLLRISGE